MIKENDTVICNDGRLGVVLAEIEHPLYKYVVKVDGQWHYFTEHEIRKVDTEC